MKIINFVPLLLIFLLLSCNKKDGHFSISAEIVINVVNAQGQNLLNAPELYNKNNVVVTQFDNGEARQYNGSTERGFLIGKNEYGLNMLKVFATLPAPSSKERSTITLIQFGNAKPDTIRSEYEINGWSTTCTKVWFNGVLKVEKTSKITPFDRSFTIVK